MANKGKVTALDATEDQKGVALKGGGGGGGISTINNLPPDSSGNFSIIGDDSTGIKVAEAAYPPGVLKVNALEAGLYQRGTIRTSTENNTQEGTDVSTAVTPRSLGSKLGAQTKGKFAMGADYGYPFEWVDLPTPPASTFVPIPFETFISDTVAQTNHSYAAIDSKSPITLQLPPRGSFKRGDIIEVENLSAVSFKITLNTDLIVRCDDKIIEDIDGRFLSGSGPGSSIKLRCENPQLWYVVRRERVSVSGGG